jgi:hypothetical protein
MFTQRKSNRKIKKEYRFIYGVTLKSLTELKQIVIPKSTTDANR